MPNARIHWATFPKWSLAVADLLLVLLLGVIDYMSGDYSLIIYYMIPVVLGSWFAELDFGVAVAVIRGLVRFCAMLHTRFYLLRII